MNLEHIAQISFKLFWIIDIIGGLPIFISLMNRFGKIQTEKAALVSACLMIIFLFAGEAMLRFLDIPLKVFAVAGAFILFIIAVEMILGVSFHKMEEANSISIVPIAFPLLAGPGGTYHDSIFALFLFFCGYCYFYPYQCSYCLYSYQALSKNQ